jgi:hypothetical protein
VKRIKPPPLNSGNSQGQKNNPSHRATYTLGGKVQVTVETDYPYLLPFLDEFYDRGDSTSASGWTLDARLIAPTRGMRVNKWGVGYFADVEHRVLHARTASPLALREGSNIAVREALVAFWEARKYTMLHAAAVRKDNLVLLLAGNERAGKTTLMLRAVLENGFDLVANDHLVVYPDGDSLALTDLPTVVSVRASTYLELEPLMPQPYNRNGVDIGVWQARTPAERIHAADDELMYYSFASLGQPRQTTVRSGSDTGTRLVIVSPTFAPWGSPAGRPEAVADAVPLLLPHIRDDWAFDRNRNQHELPRQERSRERFLADGEHLVRALSHHAEGYRWQHNGDLIPLLQTLTTGRTA